MIGAFARPPRRRGGVLTVIIIAIILVLLGCGLLLKVLSGGAYRETDVLISHMRAISVGESMYGEIVARLSATSWTNRWFKNAADAQVAVTIAGGTADYLIQDALPPAAPPPSPPPSGAPALALTPTTPNQADLMIRANYGGHSVLMYWRLTCPEDSIDALSRVIPDMYMNPLTPAGAPGTVPQLPGPFVQEVEKQIAAREANRKKSDPLLSPIRDSQSPGEVQAVLGFQPERPIADNTLAGNPSGPDTGLGNPQSTIPIASVPPPATRPPPVVPALSSPPPGSPPPPSGGSGRSWIDWFQALKDYIARKKAAVAAAQAAAAATAAAPTASAPHNGWDGQQTGSGHDHGHWHSGSYHTHWHPYGHH